MRTRFSAYWTTLLLLALTPRHALANASPEDIAPLPPDPPPAKSLSKSTSTGDPTLSLLAGEIEVDAEGTDNEGPYFQVEHTPSQLQFQVRAAVIDPNARICTLYARDTQGNIDHSQGILRRDSECPAPGTTLPVRWPPNGAEAGRYTIEAIDVLGQRPISSPLPDEHKACLARVGRALCRFLKKNDKRGHATQSLQDPDHPAAQVHDWESHAKGGFHKYLDGHGDGADWDPNQGDLHGVIQLNIVLVSRPGPHGGAPALQCAVPSEAQMNEGLEEWLESFETGARVSTLDLGGVMLQFSGRPPDPGTWQDPTLGSDERYAIGEQHGLPPDSEDSWTDSVPESRDPSPVVPDGHGPVDVDVAT
ncbi:MAG TPA: hypothetical protein VL588_03140 [Bdellovibrionota bacterium]|jgi:hypothetical protein|nr:hypothetical protein [Bdellovibrionota bacterium]